MIIKEKRGVHGVRVYHGHKNKEISRFTKAFHSNCKHINGKFFGCAGVIDTIDSRNTVHRK